MTLGTDLWKYISACLLIRFISLRGRYKSQRVRLNRQRKPNIECIVAALHDFTAVGKVDSCEFSAVVGGCGEVRGCSL